MTEIQEGATAVAEARTATQTAGDADRLINKNPLPNDPSPKTPEEDAAAAEQTRKEHIKDLEATLKNLIEGGANPKEARLLVERMGGILLGSGTSRKDQASAPAEDQAEHEGASHTTEAAKAGSQPGRVEEDSIGEVREPPRTGLRGLIADWENTRTIWGRQPDAGLAILRAIAWLGDRIGRKVDRSPRVKNESKTEQAENTTKPSPAPPEAPKPATATSPNTAKQLTTQTAQVVTEGLVTPSAPEDARTKMIQRLASHNITLKGDENPTDTIVRVNQEIEEKNKTREAKDQEQLWPIEGKNGERVLLEIQGAIDFVREQGQQPTAQQKT